MVQKDEILKAFLQNQKTYQIQRCEVRGKITSLTCQCGGYLQEVQHLVEFPIPQPPHHRKKRIAKKWKSRWERNTRGTRLINAVSGLINRPQYSCSKCGKPEGFYAAIGRNMFPVQPLPDGANPVYLLESNGESDT